MFNKRRNMCYFSKVFNYLLYLKEKSNLVFNKLSQSISHFALLCIVGLFACNLQASDNTGSVIKILVTANGYNYKSPWHAPFQYTKAGSGFVIANNEIITNAHVVSNGVYTEVTKPNDAASYQAKVKWIDHDCDLAILEVEDKEFFNKSVPFEFAKSYELRNKIQALGYPIGGNEVAITEGVISRIEMQQYSHTGNNLLLAQIDAALNPGVSGGPVLNKSTGNVVGIATQGFLYGQNMGYMIPLSVVGHFLEETSKGKYLGFPNLGLAVQKLENKSLRNKYKMTEEHTGMLVTDLSLELKKESKLRKNDIILAVNDISIANNGTILVKNNLRVGANYIISHAKIDEELKVKLLREGKEKTINVPLKHTFKDFQFIPMIHDNAPPSYYVIGGIVLQPLTVNYLQSFDQDWTAKAPMNLLHYYFFGRRTNEQKEKVVLNRVLPAQFNLGYQHYSDLVVTKLNGKPVSSLQDIIKTVENTKKQFIELTTENNEQIVIDVKLAKQNNTAILNKYLILDDRSDNFKFG